MKVLLINSPTKEHPIVRDMAGGLGFDGGEAIVLPPLELAYIATTLLNKGNEVKIIDSDVENYSAKEVYQIIRGYNPETVIATVSLPSIYEDCSFLRGVREYTSAKVIAKTAINYPDILRELLKRSSADFCIYAECDLNVEEIILDREKKGTAYFQNNEFIVEENNFVQDLDKLPLPARQLLPNEKYRYILLGNKVTVMQTSRGCPFPCLYYCPYPLVQGRKWRARSPQHVIREIEDIVNKYHIKKVLFRDATFTFGRERTREICKLILEKELKINWWCETRVDHLDLDLMQIMRRAGCLGMNIGVETGDSQLMQTQAKIGMTLAKLKVVRKTTQKLGLKLHFLLMIGLPDETRKSLYETYRLIYDLKPETIGICVVTPYPGTPLYNKAKRKGWLETEDWAKYGGHYPVMHTDNLSTRDLLEARQLINQGFSLFSVTFLRRWIKSKQLKHRFKKWILQKTLL